MTTDKKLGPVKWRAEGKLWLTVAEAATAMSLSEWQVREMIRLGKLPCTRAGRAIRISLVDVEQWQGYTHDLFIRRALAS